MTIPWNKGRKEIRKEVIEKQSKSHIGKKPWNYGIGKPKRINNGRDTKMKKGMTGKSSISYKNGIGCYRRMIFEQFENKVICQMCGENSCKLLAHHKDGNRNNNTIENLMILCYKCHFKIHGAMSYKELIVSGGLKL